MESGESTHFRQMLLARRAEIFDRYLGLESGWRALEERHAELEDSLRLDDPLEDLRLAVFRALLDDDHDRRYDLAYRLEELGLVGVPLLHVSHEVVNDVRCLVRRCGRFGGCQGSHRGSSRNASLRGNGVPKNDAEL